MVKFIVKDVTEPKDGYEVIANSYWLCENGDPKKALFCGQSIQANKNRKILEWSLTKDMYKNHSEPLTIVHLPVAYIPRRDF